MIRKIFESGNNIIDVKYFYYDKKYKTFSQEASSLPSRSWYPGMDEITLYNPKTGNKVVFKYVDADTDREGEIQGWNYSSNDVLFTGNLLIVND